MRNAHGTVHVRADPACTGSQQLAAAVKPAAHHGAGVHIAARVQRRLRHVHGVKHNVAAVEHRQVVQQQAWGRGQGVAVFQGSCMASRTALPLLLQCRVAGEQPGHARGRQLLLLDLKQAPTTCALAPSPLAPPSSNCAEVLWNSGSTAKARSNFFTLSASRLASSVACGERDRGQQHWGKEHDGRPATACHDRGRGVSKAAALGKQHGNAAARIPLPGHCMPRAGPLAPTKQLPAGADQAAPHPLSRASGFSSCVRRRRLVASSPSPTPPSPSSPAAHGGPRAVAVA